MNGKYLIGAVVETVIKVVVLAAVILFVFKTASSAYDFGYRVFADQPVSTAGGRTITVGIAENASVKEIAEMLEEKGLIEDARLFVVQELLSSYHGEIRAGIYDLSTSMTAEEMLAVMCASDEDTIGAEEDQAAEEEIILEDEENSRTGEDMGDMEGNENTEGMAAE
jgi:UPF0755 protein